jgi:hypothetical protein
MSPQNSPSTKEQTTPAIVTHVTGVEQKIVPLPDKAPVLTVEQKMQFFKAQSSVNAAQLMLERTEQFKNHEKMQKEFQDVINSLSKVCGDHYTLGLNAEGVPICQENQVPQTPKN